MSFLTESLCNLGQEKLPLNKKLVIGGGLNDGKEALSIEKGHWETVLSLKSDHEKRTQDYCYKPGMLYKME